MSRRRRSFLVKFAAAVGLTWIGVVLFVGVPNMQKYASDEEVLDILKANRREAQGSGSAGNGHHDHTAWNIPVIERPDPDRLRFQEAMRQDAERELQLKEQQRRQQQIQEEIARRRMRDRVIPPFREDQKRSSQILNSVNDSLTKQLIETGLIVPKWNIDKETPLNMATIGENGNGVVIDKDKLSASEKQKYEDGFQRNAFNQYASDQMSLHRSLPDVRDAECKTLKYQSNLPDTSVIVIFHNEAWSVLLRTVHSILDRTPPHLLREVILVDDFSDNEYLKKPLEDYVAKLGKVKVMRAKKREGLIRARLLGASVARGQVLTFLDSHCECTIGWVEPLLDRIAQNKSNVVTPIIDVVDDNTLRYQYSNARTTSVGGFDWNMQFNWHPIPQRERSKKKSDVEPVHSPTMAGGLFSISKEYFEYLGTYDPGMDIWGGENLELSFRVWMCGGVLEIVLCSHVGHIFRKSSPYKWRTGVNVVQKNSIRLAEVWMDDYKKYYYERFNFILGDYGDVTSRKELRKRLQCKTFDWYIKNIYPELFIPGDSVASGEIRNKALGTFNGQRQPICLDSASDKNAYNKPLNLWPCHNMGGNQYWMLSKMGEIRRDEACLDFAGQSVIIYPCHAMKGNQEWAYGPDNSLRHVSSNKCLELSEDGMKINMVPCSGIDRQVWLWKRKEVIAPFTTFPR